MEKTAGGFFSPRTPEPGTLVRNLNQRNSPQGRLLVSVDLTAGKTSATGGCLRFVPGPALAIWQTKKQTVCAWTFLCRQESSRATEKAGDFRENKRACFSENLQPFPCALAHRRAGKAGLPGSGMFSFSLLLRYTCLGNKSYTIRKWRGLGQRPGVPHAPAVHCRK